MYYRDQVAPSEHELIRLLERSPIGMYRSRADGRFTYVNPALARLLGYDRDELLAKNLNTDIYVDPTARPVLLAEFLDRGELDGARTQWRHRDGHTLLVRVYCHVVERGGDGESSFDASVVDVTELEAANQLLYAQRDELEHTAATLDQVVRQMPAVWWLMDRDLRILRNGGDIFGLMGHSAERFRGKTLYDSMAAGEAPQSAIEQHERVLAGEVMTFQGEHAGKHLSTTMAPIFRDGAIIGLIGTSIDVTSQRALERRMVDAQRAESLGVLAGGLAHDFNNLLVAILGNADLGLRDVAAGQPGHAALENVRIASLRAAELTDQLLAYAGRGGMPPSRVVARTVIDELVRITSPTMPAGVRVTVEIDRALTVRGDAGQLRQVFLNFITNARDALDRQPGSIAIRGQLARHDGAPDPDDIVATGAGSYVRFEIEDSGPGISDDQRRRIFEPFFTTKPTGHGLGLAAVLGIVRSHGGGLRLHSEPGRGARFVVLWPAATTPQEMVVAVPIASHATRTVLVIDDEDLVREVVARMIEDLGYSAVTAADGIAGLAMLDAGHIDAVLVDLTMPRMNGADVVAELRRKQPHLPVVLCTGYDRDRRGPVQADAYLPKPFRLEALESTLAKLLP